MQFEDGGGVAQGTALPLAAVGLDGAELVERFVELFGEASAMETEGGDGAVGVDDVECDAVFFRGRIHGAVEEIGFEERNAIEAP